MTHREQASTLNIDDITALLERSEELDRALGARDRRIDELKAQLEWLTRQLFGEKSEKQLHLDSSHQLALGEGVLPAPIEPTSEVTTIGEHKRRHSKPSRPEGERRLRFDENVEVEEIIVVDDSLEGVDPASYTVVDFKKSYRLLQNPSTYKIVLVKRPVVKMKEDGRFSCPAIPAEIFEGSFADASFLASVVIDKLRYHLPLYRQHQRILASGIQLDRSTLTRYMQRVAELLRPVYESQLQAILRSRVLAIDETPIRAGRKSKGKMKQAWLWPLMGDRSEIAFHYASTRARRVLDELLAQYEGTLLNDGYSAYESFCKAKDGVIRAQCWVHARRQFVKAEESEPALVAEALRRIAQLYELESELSEQSTPEEIQELRGQRCRPLVESYLKWLRDCLNEQVLLPSSPFTRAAQYSLDRADALKVFLEDPAVAMDTNHLEREIRPIALGRKNWLFCWSELGAEQLGILQSLVATCRLQGVDTYTYLVDVMQRVASHPAKDVEQLTPRIWKQCFANEPLPSLMELLETQSVIVHDTSTES
jgi:hypothetical protein